MNLKLKAYINSLERLDIKVITSVLLLCLYGLIMVYSASAYGCRNSQKFNYDPNYLLVRQALFFIIGLVAMFMVRFLLNVERIKGKIAAFIYFAGILIIFSLFTSLAVSSHQATRWIRLGPISFQVAELTKICVVIGLSAFIDRFRKNLDNKFILVMIYILAAIPAGLVFVISDNLSSALIIAGIAFLYGWVTTGFTKLHIAMLGLAGGGVFAIRSYVSNLLTRVDSIENLGFRWRRIAAWIEPERFASDESMQPLQGLYAVASGGLFGKGLGHSVQKMERLPEAQNDMIFSVICEELGIVGAVVLILMFMYLIYNLIRMSAKASTLYGKLLTLGVAFHIALQAFINICVVLTIIPNTGVSLPFISYGGSALIFTMAEIGMCLAIYRRSINVIIHKKSRELMKD